MTSKISRRGFAQVVSSAVVAGTAARGESAQAQGALTAAEIVDRIKSKLAAEGIPWRPSNFDMFHLGDPNITVTGIAVSFQATFDVLKRAAAAGKNFVISHECTFWDGFDPIAVMQNNPVCQAKIRFAEQHKMAVWRIHDHWHRRRPDPIFGALALKLGWDTEAGRPPRYVIPETSLEEVARQVQSRLETKNVVVIGDRNLRVKTIGDCVHVLPTVLPALRTCDVALVGETGQYDTFEYVRDAVSLGQKKGLIMISHERLEEWGMRDFVDWLKPAVPELPIEWISAGDLFQVPSIRA
jgi:putative NIF3 family GTP cyclohydrolase 1 type 2